MNNVFKITDRILIHSNTEVIGFNRISRNDPNLTFKKLAISQYFNEIYFAKMISTNCLDF